MIRLSESSDQFILPMDTGNILVLIAIVASVADSSATFSPWLETLLKAASLIAIVVTVVGGVVAFIKAGGSSGRVFQMPLKSSAA